MFMSKKMKHPELKFSLETKVPVDLEEEVKERISLKIALEDIPNLKNLPKNKLAVITRTDGTIYKAFYAKIDGKYFVMPEPEPIILYFNIAYWNYVRLNSKKSNIENLLNYQFENEDAIKLLYDFLGFASSIIIFLFMTIETTINRCIPYDWNYTRKSNGKIFSKAGIEESIPFDEKIKLVLPQATHLNFQKSYGIKYSHLMNLKNYRDEIVHTKSVNPLTPSINSNYSRSFNFDYPKTFDAVKSFCNFYLQTELIEDCPCNSDI